MATNDNRAMVEAVDFCDCGHLWVNHHDGNGVWGKGCNQPLAMELQCPCQKTGDDTLVCDRCGEPLLVRTKEIEVCGLCEREMQITSEIALAVAAERTRIVGDLMALYVQSDSMTEFGEEAHAYLYAADVDR